MDMFVCSDCAPADVKKPQTKLTESPIMNGKVRLIICRFCPNIVVCLELFKKHELLEGNVSLRLHKVNVTTDRALSPTV